MAPGPHANDHIHKVAISFFQLRSSIRVLRARAVQQADRGDGRAGLALTPGTRARSRARACARTRSVYVRAGG